MGRLLDIWTRGCYILLMEIAETVDFLPAGSWQKSTRNMRCHSTRSFSQRFSSSSSVASSSAHPGKEFERLHAWFGSDNSQCLQRHHLSIRRSTWCLLRHPPGYQLPQRPQNATTATIRPTRPARLDLQSTRYLLRNRHDGALPIPAHLARHRE